MAQASSRENYRDAYQRDARQVQAAAYAIGVDCKTLDINELADSSRLVPKNYPVICYVDPVGDYLHTLKAPGDAQNCLIKYVENGGVVIALSRGGAFRTPMRNESGGLVETSVQPGLDDLLMLKILRPNEPALAGVTAFDHPPNTAMTFYFENSGRLPGGLTGLPPLVSLAPMVSAPFYPMLETRGRGTAIYELKDSNGTVYGPGLFLLPRGRGMVLVVDHLLWESRIEDRPFSERGLPLILYRALMSARR
jgi:hypothetical protein